MVMMLKSWFPLLGGLLLAATALADERFPPLGQDGIHDPGHTALAVLQPPAEALAPLPADALGNPDWMAALELKIITPRTGLTGKEKMLPIDLDIIMQNTASLPHVRFRHATHTQWLTCSNCHTDIFLPLAGGNYISMGAILQGRYCGTCHGTVAFHPTDNCARCHSVPAANRGLR